MRTAGRSGRLSIRPPSPAPSGLPGERGPRRPTRYGLTIQFEARPGDPEIGRLVESTVWVNEAHAAYKRAVASRSEGYHLALAVALALAPLAVEPAHEHGFVTAFLDRWGAALSMPPISQCPEVRRPTWGASLAATPARGRR